MAAGVNYNNVWAARGVPIDVIAVRQKAGEPYDFHIGGERRVRHRLRSRRRSRQGRSRRRVVVHPGWWDPRDPWIAAGATR